MDNETCLKKIIVGAVGKMMIFRNLNTERLDAIKIVSVRRCGKTGCNLFFQGEEFSIGFFAPIGIFSVVKKETENGWEAGDLLDDVHIGGIPFGQAIASFIGE